MNGSVLFVNRDERESVPCRSRTLPRKIFN